LPPGLYKITVNNLPDIEEIFLSEVRRGCEGGRPRCRRRVSVSAFASPSHPRPHLDLNKDRKGTKDCGPHKHTHSRTLLSAFTPFQAAQAVFF